MTKKVFVPMCDELLEQGTAGPAKLVPFDPAFLEFGVRATRRPDRKPANWIQDSDYSAACERLRQSRLEEEACSA
ncbi:MAG: hypothetical protein ACFHX7_10920 [Pseudomonadota bacterium]